MEPARTAAAMTYLAAPAHRHRDELYRFARTVRFVDKLHKDFREHLFSSYAYSCTYILPVREYIHTLNGIIYKRFAIVNNPYMMFDLPNEFAHYVSVLLEDWNRIKDVMAALMLFTFTFSVEFGLEDEDGNWRLIPAPHAHFYVYDVPQVDVTKALTDFKVKILERTAVNQNTVNYLTPFTKIPEVVLKRDNKKKLFIYFFMNYSGFNGLLEMKRDNMISERRKKIFDYILTIIEKVIYKIVANFFNK